MHGLKKAKKYMNLRARTPPKHRADERQQQLLQRVGVAKRAPGEFELLVVGVKLHAPGRGLEITAAE